ncbi:DUF4845 domain-containing protein [Acinetobacter sp. NCu2D-2]|uniref:DUF4845 domain-containing protein n=1 Tax=Acinetobacter sp. NCu2D-2 TaxID=1608473 RepID=UPI0007CDE644|nr:DUF4845 domain-containing protein [Acinetobacter sp. NCu2D-2]ANF82126.1 DUF4845 domain-containing protein [Acinetobacter sp. NCu2D-2]
MRHQKGASYIAILFAIVGFAFIAKIAIAVWGPYWDDRVIDSQIEELIASAPKNTPEKFIQQLGQRLDMNNVRDFDIKENIKVENAGGLAVHKSYEVRKNFIMNVDLIMKFEKDFGKSTSQTQ